MSEPIEQDTPRTFPEDYVRTLREENARRRHAEKTVSEQLARVRKALGAEDSDAADLGELAERMRSRSEADRTLAQEALVRAELTRVAQELDLVDTDAALRDTEHAFAANKAYDFFRKHL